MGGDYLLHTGVANLLALPVASVVTRAASAQAIYLPVIVIGELYDGAYLYTHRHNSTKFFDLYDAFVQRYIDRLLAPNLETAQVFGAISGELKAKGQPIQHNDIWIAALARQFGLTLATRDHDFERVSGLSVEFW